MGCATVDYCSLYLTSQGSVVIKRLCLKGTRGGKGLLQFKLQSIRRGSQGRNSHQRPRKNAAYWLASLLSYTSQDYLPRGGITHSEVATYIYHQSGRCPTSLLIDRPADVLGALSELRAPSSQVTLVCVELTEKLNQPPLQCTSIIETAT